MFMGPRNWFQEINSASLCSLAGRYHNLIPPQFLAPIDFLKIPALYFLSIFSISHFPHSPIQSILIQYSPSLTSHSLKFTVFLFQYSPSLTSHFLLFSVFLFLSIFSNSFTTHRSRSGPRYLIAKNTTFLQMKKFTVFWSKNFDNQPSKHTFLNFSNFWW